ncbi:hypothetical protein WN51_01460 [Melipona quadrifasciata]|uniref:Uncharacterized protein n=1 Tax=Melipona quadrifasciata TaxID=166423 RepID=A0A0N0BET1_9HYME|nr:hypothetical protein WN51_01460 [Melipona quadrifasciata]
MVPLRIFRLIDTTNYKQQIVPNLTNIITVVELQSYMMFYMTQIIHSCKISSRYFWYSVELRKYSHILRTKPRLLGQEKEMNNKFSIFLVSEGEEAEHYETQRTTSDCRRNVHALIRTVASGPFSETNHAGVQVVQCDMKLP